ncbi:short-chain dehydrogenase [Dendrothele bispora CBS 962.96]|uniref:Short-chain dehydrogenase n=1 Tax=Dendrothele bispora (strain CBS 962.96) TaxID=1314807 RepID=A0A4S8MR66_DENBC|nr:short-chain dehydrogenase [Dendrothele bispora CBS 962.96]
MAPRSFFQFVREQYSGMPPVVKTDLAGKTVVVVGANVGIGFEAARHFASMNPGRLIIACRNQERGEAALSELKSSTGFSRIELWLVDFTDFASVKGFADKFDREGGRLDILVENAGIIPGGYDTTKDGWLTILQTNCIAPSLLALRLLPHMWKTAEKYSTTPRLVLVASDVHYWSSLHKNPVVAKSPDILKLMSSFEYYSSTSHTDQYQDSKLLNVLFARDLQSRLLQSNVTVNSVTPAFCVSQLRRSVSGIMACASSVMERLLAYTAEEGSRQLVYGAIGGTEEEMRGGFVNFSKVVEPSDFVISKEGDAMEEKIWNELMDLLPLVGSSKESLKQYLRL